MPDARPQLRGRPGRKTPPPHGNREAVSTRRICINVRLALYPPECLEYVVVHELCHLLERGHGPRFHQLMDRFMPDWKQRRDKLR